MSRSPRQRRPGPAQPERHRRGLALVLGPSAGTLPLRGRGLGRLWGEGRGDRSLFPAFTACFLPSRASAKPAPLGPRWTLIPLCHRGTWLGSSPPQVPGTAAKTERWEPWAQAARLEAAALPRTPTASGLGTRSRAGARWQRAGRPGRGCCRAAGARPGHLGGQVAGRACAQGRPGVRAEGTGLHARLCRLLRTSFLWG